jgi:hypothetical protein
MATPTPSPAAPTKFEFETSCPIWVSELVGARRCAHLAIMEHNSIHQILSFDSGFDVFPGIKRLAWKIHRSRGSYLGTPDEVARQEYQKPANNHLKGGLQERCVHVAVANVGNGHQFHADHGDREHRGHVKVGN